MPVSEDLINFDLIETHKENIQSLPGGRSAKALASTFSPNPSFSPTPGDTRNLNDAIRQEYESELKSIADSDDPLDVFDRYVKWTLSAYPSAQATPESQLRPLLERATKAFQSVSHYKSDPRYLKLWLNYIRFFSDSPRETFAYLARHNIGEGLALFYEEFAAWLEGVGRWNQAREVYELGIERGARPSERLIRKFGEFERRYAARPQDTDEPSSPALPTVRPALAAKLDPFAPSGARPVDAQATQSRSGNGVSTAVSRNGRPKISIFSDADAAPPSAKDSSIDSAKGWDNIGTISERKKENLVEARPWTGETLKGGKRSNVVPKMAVFRDESSALKLDTPPNENLKYTELQQVTNPKNGKLERVFVNLSTIYPEHSKAEMSFEELRASARGWLHRTWSAEEHRQHLASCSQSDERAPESLEQRPTKKIETKKSKDSPIQNNSEVTSYVSDNTTAGLDLGHTVALDIAHAGRDSRAKRTRIKEVKGETQTIKINLSSPTKPKIRRKASTEPTMTLHTKAATEDILDIFNQPLKNVDPLAGPPESDDETDYDDDDYTSGGESTGTGHISAASEFGDTQSDPKTQPLSSETGAESVSPWSEFTASKHVPQMQDCNETHEDVTRHSDEAFPEETYAHGTEELEQPGSEAPSSVPVHADAPIVAKSEARSSNAVTPNPIDEDDEDSAPRTRYIPLPPEDYEAPMGMRRDPAMQAHNRLPFMTPILEKTESSLGAFTIKTETDYFNSKTPSRKMDQFRVGLGVSEDLLSSPLQKLASEDQPAWPSKVLELAEQRSQDTTGIEFDPTVVKEKQCNPTDDTIRAQILKNANPPLALIPGFHDYRPESFHKTSDIRKFIKSVTRGKLDGKTTSSICLPPTIRFKADLSTSYTIKRELGKGAFAPVYLAEKQRETDSVDDSLEHEIPQSFIAMKCEHPPSPWEFYMMHLVHERIVSSTTRSVLHPSIVRSLCKPMAIHLFTDEAYLLESYLDQGTLLNLVNLAKSDPSGQSNTLDESIAMFFTVEMLRTIEAMHSVGILHGDIKVDNCLIRLGSSSASQSNYELAADSHWSSQYSHTGEGGWSNRGLCLIDFGRSIDLRAFSSDVQFIADWKTGKQDCPEMREMRPWTWQIDYWGMAGVAHSLLFGKYMDDNVVAIPRANQNASASSISTQYVADDTGTNNSSESVEDINSRNATNRTRPRMRPREPFKRYWQTQIWARLFDILLNPVLTAAADADKGGEPGAKMPCTSSLAAVRTEMETWLEGEGGKRNGGLKAGIRRLEEKLREARGR